MRDRRDDARDLLRGLFEIAAWRVLHCVPT